MVGMDTHGNGHPAPLLTAWQRFQNSPLYCHVLYMFPRVSASTGVLQEALGNSSAVINSTAWSTRAIPLWTAGSHHRWLFPQSSEGSQGHQPAPTAVCKSSAPSLGLTMVCMVSHSSSGCYGRLTVLTAVYRVSRLSAGTHQHLSFFCYLPSLQSTIEFGTELIVICYSSF